MIAAQRKLDRNQSEIWSLLGLLELFGVGTYGLLEGIFTYLLGLGCLRPSRHFNLGSIQNYISDLFNTIYGVHIYHSKGKD